MVCKYCCSQRVFHLPSASQSGFVSIQNVMKQNSVKRISPVTQFVLLLSPVVMSCFFLVYALAGWVVDGREKSNWSIEAPDVAIWTGSGIVIYCVLVMLYTRWKGAARYHMLNLSSWCHLVLAVLLTVSVFVAIRL